MAFNYTYILTICALILILVFLGPVYCAIAALSQIAYIVADHNRWIAPRYVSSRIHYALAHLLPARLYNYFWPPPPPPDGYIIIDPRTGKCTLIVFEKGRPHEAEAEEDGYVWEEQEPEVEEVRCQRCKRKGVERRRKPAYCARCNAPYCGQKCRKADNRAHGRKCRG